MDYLASALQYPERCRPAAGRRPAARRPAHHRRPALPVSRSATKTAATSRPSPRCARASPRRSSARWSAAASGRRAVRASGYSSCSCATRTGSIRAIWFNQPFLADVFHPHQRVILFGKLELTLARPAAPEPAVRDPAAGRGATRRAEQPATTRRCIPAGSCRSTRRPET